MGLSIDRSSDDRMLYNRINFLFRLISWLIDRSNFFFIDCATLGWWLSGRCEAVARNQVMIESNILTLDFV
jgi:hypothetical protein